MDFHQLDRLLADTAADGVLDTDEKLELREVGATLDSERLRYLRNRAFAITRDVVAADPTRALDSLRWLEQVVRTLDLSAAVAVASSSVFFSPGDSCLRKLRELCRTAKRQLDICVFTIADDRLTEEILDAHRRGVAVRIISDDDKRIDDGSDIIRLAAQGIEIRLDDSRFHMHHKFAVFDGRILANGSFNWTRTASTSNNENLVVSEDAYLVRCFAGQFDTLWDRFTRLR
ncbi:phospholipase D-like domain-containing protein [Lysobacter korlensis]|uniref:phospholipase D n=1 Tax=Lysobacter korlensis TaxID=553636 RepID=A0ABV6RID3_9GAMM